jgi:prepilin-type N-terminal cleavage/methylation domain-containing protein
MRGFSLLEVLIAVVILSLGLLALASLQLSLIRSSAETKSQTTAMSLAKEKIESLDSYESLGGTSNTCTAPADPPTDPSGTCYRAITDVPSATVATIGGVTYSRGVTVARYVYQSDTGLYVLRGDTLLDSAIEAISSAAVPGKEYKRVVATVSWVDATGTSQQIQVEDIISGLNPSDSLAVTDLGDVTTPRNAVSIIVNPSSDPGVIPIAIGNGTDTAATNPRPVVVSQGQNSTTVETRFDILTYAALTGDTAQAQSRVETAVVGCRCTRAASGTQTTYRPTYWNGFQYKEPITITTGFVSAPTTGGAEQSELCIACCRDHQDPSGVDPPLFDPRRTTHDHFLDSDLTTAISASGGNYSEACRLIRVNGIFRVAAEPYNDHYGLLATVGLTASTPTTVVADAVPSTGTGSVAESYQTFVINYLKQRFVDGTAYNTALDASSVTGFSALQSPSSAGIANTSSPKFLHARGLYIDYLHTDAIAAITSAKATCVAQSCTADETQTAVLKLLPFTSLNATELAKWQSSNASKVGISLMEDFSETIDEALPVSGRATYNSGASGDTVTATTDIQRSSAGLAITSDVFLDTAITDNATVDLDDTQLFTIGTSSGGSFPGGETFSVVLTGSDLLANVTISNAAQVSFGSTSYKSCTPDGTNMTPYGCVTDTTFGLGGSTNIKIGNYDRSGNKTVQNSCTRPNPASNANDTTSMPYVINFDVSSATVDSIAASVGAAQNPNLSGVAGEYTVITANPVNVNSTVTVNFSALSYKCPANWSTFLDSGGDDSGMTPDNSNSSTVCTGSGSNKVPAWDTTSSFINCWSGFTP